MRNYAIAAMLALLAAGPAQAAADPAQAPVCFDAVGLALMKPTLAAADKLLACAQVPGQTPYMIANSRFKRFGMLEELDKRELAEAELVALTTAPISTFPVFTNSASGFVIVGGEHSIGVTQVDLLAARATYRLYAEDKPAALDLANRAIALARNDPAYVFDAAPAFTVRARLAAVDGNNDAALRLAIRAYLRGSDDEWIAGVIKGQDQATQDQLAQVRTTLRERLAGYDYAITAHARIAAKAEDINRLVVEANKTMVDLKVFELNQLGPL